MDPEEAEGDDEELPPIRLHYPRLYATRTWHEHKENPAAYPYPGGRNQQPAMLMADWAELDRRYFIIYDELKPLADEDRGRNQGRPRDVGVGDLFDIPTDAPDVGKLFEG